MYILNSDFDIFPVTNNFVNLLILEIYYIILTNFRHTSRKYPKCDEIWSLDQFEIKFRNVQAMVLGMI